MNWLAHHADVEYLGPSSAFCAHAHTLQKLIDGDRRSSEEIIGVKRTVHTRAGTWAVPFGDGSWHDPKHGTARNILGRAVSKISAWRATWPGPYFGPCLD